MIRAKRALRFAVDHYLTLPLGALAALAWANGRPESYFAFAHAWSFAVNDVAMVFFFALVTEEIIEATVPGGALHTWRRVALPVVGAVGGILGSALVYLAYLRSGDELSVLGRGWPIPGAVDLAFAYVIARSIWRRHPAIPFFLLIGIATNALGMLIVELKYPVADRHVLGPVFIAAAIGIAAALRRARVKNFWPYVLLSGYCSWWGFFSSGLHPALALVPIVPFLTHARRGRPLFATAPASARDGLSRFDRAWKYPVQGVLLGFALVNAGVILRGFGTGTKAVAIAALAGKPLGVLAAISLAVACGLRLPQRVGWRDLVVIAFTSSIGFAYALFFATATIPLGPVLVEAKLGALLTVAGALLALAAGATLRVGRYAGHEGDRARRRRQPLVDPGMDGTLERILREDQAFSAGGAARHA
jgi:NhaA family Na+:H+ antiporter